MSPDTVFVVVCPSCHSQSNRSILYLGLSVRCNRCHLEFRAIDSHSESASAEDPVGIWLTYSTSYECTDTPRPPSPR